MERIENIKYMESIFDEINDAVICEDIEKLKNLSPKIKALISYYESKTWIEDFTLDENGFFPPDLKRGVLSEDGIYNLILNLNELNII